MCLSSALVVCSVKFITCFSWHLILELCDYTQNDSMVISGSSWLYSHSTLLFYLTLFFSDCFYLFVLINTHLCEIGTCCPFYCRAVVKKKGRNNVTVDELVHVITPKGRGRELGVS